MDLELFVSSFFCFCLFVLALVNPEVDVISKSMYGYIFLLY